MRHGSPSALLSLLVALAGCPGAFRPPVEGGGDAGGVIPTLDGAPPHTPDASGFDAATAADAATAPDASGDAGVPDAAPPDVGPPPCADCFLVRPGFPVSLALHAARLGALAMPARPRDGGSGPVVRDVVVLMDTDTHDQALVAWVDATGTVRTEEQAGGAAPSGPVVVDVTGDGWPDVAWADFRGTLHVSVSQGAPAVGYPRSIGASVLGQGLATWEEPSAPGALFSLALVGNLFRVVAATATSLAGWPAEASESTVSDGVAGCQLVPGASVESAGVVVVGGQARLAAWDHAGTLLPGFPTAGTVVQGAWAPVCVDLDGDAVDEVAYGDPTGHLHVFNANGSVRAGFPVRVGSGVAGALAAGDLDGDGLPEIVALAPGTTAGTGRVAVVDGFGLAVPGFPAVTPGVFSVTALVADLDGDDRNDVMGITAAGDVVVLGPGGVHVPPFPLALGAAPQGAPALDDLDGDGAWDLAVVTTDRTLYVASLFPGGAVRARAPWTRFRGEDGRSNRYAGEAPRP